MEAAKGDSAHCELQLLADLVPPKDQHDMPSVCLNVMGKLKGCTTHQQLLLGLSLHAPLLTCRSLDPCPIGEALVHHQCHNPSWKGDLMKTIYSQELQDQVICYYVDVSNTST